jgi:hypothetical protein
MEAEMETPEAFFLVSMATANDPRSNCVLSAGFLLVRLWKTGQDSWKLINRDLFLAAVPGFGNDEIYDLLEASCPNGIFNVDLYFANLQGMRNTRARAAVATAVIFYDMNESGEAELAASWMDMIIKQVKIPKKYSRPPEKHRPPSELH